MIKSITKFISALLILTNLLSFIPTVAMASDTSTGSTDNESGGASGTPSAGDSVTWNYAGGYRVYLTQSTLIGDNLNPDGSLHFEGEGEDTFKYRSSDYLNMYKSYAIYEVTGVDKGTIYADRINTGTSLYSYYWDAKGYGYPRCTVLRGSTGGSSNPNPDFAELVEGLTVGEIKSFKPWQAKDATWAEEFKNWANGVFNDDNFNYDKFLSNYISLLKADGRQVPSWFPTTKSDYISGKFAIVVEPVVVVKLQGGILYCFSAQDYFSEDKNSLYNTRSTDTSFSHKAEHGFYNSANTLYNIFFEYERNNNTISTMGKKEAGYGIYKSADQIENESGSVITEIVVNAGTIKDNGSDKPYTYAVGEAGTYTDNKNYNKDSQIYRSTFLTDDSSSGSTSKISSVQALLDSMKPTATKPQVDFNFSVSAIGNTQATYNFLHKKDGFTEESLLVDAKGNVDAWGIKERPDTSKYISSVGTRNITDIGTFVQALTNGSDLPSENTRVAKYQLFTVDAPALDVDTAFLRSLVEAHTTIKVTKSVVSGGLLNFGATYSPSLVDATDVSTYADANAGMGNYKMKNYYEQIQQSGYSPFAKLAARTVLKPESMVIVTKALRELDFGNLSDAEVTEFLNKVSEYCIEVFSTDTNTWEALKGIRDENNQNNDLPEGLSKLLDEFNKSYKVDVSETLCKGVVEASVLAVEMANGDSYAVSAVNSVTPEVNISSADYNAMKGTLDIKTDKEMTSYILSTMARSINDTSKITAEGATSVGTAKNSMGIAVALTTQTTPILSKSATYTITDTKKTWSDISEYKYNSEEVADIPLPDTNDVPNSYVVVIPRGTTLTLDNFDDFKTTLESAFNTVTKATVASNIPGDLAKELKLGENSCVKLLGDIITKGQNPKKLCIKVGSVGTTDGSLVGYDVVYILDERKGDKSIKSDMSVRDYELNYVYKTLLGETLGELIKATSTYFADTSAKYQNSNGENVAVFGNHIETGNSFGHTYANVYSCHSDLLAYAYKVLSIEKGDGYGGTVLDQEDQNGGTVLDQEDQNNSNYKNVLYNTLTGVFDIEANDPKEIVSNNNKNIVINHAVNLRRADFDDSLQLSKFFDANYASAILEGNSSKQEGVEELFDTNLGSRIGLGYAKKPDARKTGSDVNINSSDNILGTGSDKYIWTVKSNCINLTPVTCSYSEVGSEDIGTEVIYVPANVVAFTNGRNTASYDVSETCYKYLAVERDTSSVTNKLLSVDKADSRGTLDYTATNPSSFDAEYLKYRSASVFSASEDTVLSIYPEIAMTAYIINGSDTLENENDVAKISMYVLGELARRVKPSGLNILTLNPTSTSGVGGTVTSTSFASGTSADDLSSNNEGIPVASGGINVDVSAGLKDALDLNISGFYLDVIDRDLDTDTAIQAGSANSDSETVFKSYNEIVARDTDTDSLRKTWGNSYSAVSAFNNWTASVKDSLSADIALQTYNGGAQETYVDSIASPDLAISGGTSADVLASYPLMIANGELVTSAIEGVSAYYTEYTEKAANSYDALIKAIAMKYYSVDSDDVTNDMRSKAEEIFKNSGLYQSICKAIESINDDDNNSTKKLRSNGEADLTGERWYDEQVRTIVVREYGYTGDDALVVNDVIANTKVDYSLVPNMGASQTEDYSVGYRARWFLTVYLKEGVLGYEGSSYFDPTSSGTRATAETDGTVLINATPIFNADFMIGNAVTSGMIN